MTFMQQVFIEQDQALLEAAKSLPSWRVMVLGRREGSISKNRALESSSEGGALEGDLDSGCGELCERDLDKGIKLWFQK